MSRRVVGNAMSVMAVQAGSYILPLIEFAIAGGSKSELSDKSEGELNKSIKRLEQELGFCAQNCAQWSLGRV